MVIIIVVLAIVAGIGIYSILHPEKQKEAREDLQRRKEEKRQAPAPAVYRKIFRVVSEDRKFDTVESRFQNREFWQNDLYESTLRELEENGHDEGDIVYKWEIRPLLCRVETGEGSAKVYASADGETYEFIGSLPDLASGDIRILSGELDLIAEGGTGYEILYNSETGKYRKGKEKYYPWRFKVRAVYHE